MAVAKSYKDLPQHGEPYEKNNKMYVVVECKNGHRKEVRWYTDQEYAKMYPDEPKPSSGTGICGGRKIRSTKDVLGFKNGYIWIFKGDTYPLIDWFKESGANFRTFWGWNFTSEQELPELPAGIEAKQLMWESVAYVDEDTLKSQSAIDEAVADLLFDESPSEYQGAVGDRLELEVLIKKAIELSDGYYGPKILYIFEDSNKNIYTWITSPRNLQLNTIVKIRGTVKQHVAYRKEKQTQLTNCRIS